MHKVNSMSYCEVSDVFEEDGPPTDHFHGGFGLLNLQGIRKPSFFAYRFLNQLSDTEFACDDEDTIVCGSENGYQILTWNPAFRQNMENILYYGSNLPPQSEEDVRITLHGVKNGRYTVRISSVGYQKNDAYTAFLQIPHGDSLSRAKTEELKTLADGHPESEYVTEITVCLLDSPSPTLTRRQILYIS
jgi:xylan 1,4-beta-xylosidase